MKESRFQISRMLSISSSLPMQLSTTLRLLRFMLSTISKTEGRPSWYSMMKTQQRQQSKACVVSCSMASQCASTMQRVSQM